MQSLRMEQNWRTSINERPFTSAKFWQELHPPIYPWTKQRSSNLCST